MEWAVGLGQVATVAQLVGYAGGLILKIKRTAETARQNVRECENLAGRVSDIDELLPRLKEDPVLMQALTRLRDTLEEAHELVASCQDKGTANKFFKARRHAERFREINGRIDSHLLVLSLISNVALEQRFDQIQIQLDNHTAVPSPGNLLPNESTSAMVSHDPHAAAAETVRFTWWTWAEIAAATGNFSHVLGEGCSGTVHKGRRLHHGRDVAVKVLRDGRQGVEDAFVTELEILSPLRHGNIVRLLGWCSEEDEDAQAQRMLVCEYMANGTLRDHLRGRPQSPVTTSWRMRVEALLGASRAIDHLHRHAAPGVIHRNVTSSNILLDASWAPRLSGFGASVLRAPSTGADADEHQGQPVTEVMGTFGYICPEYERTKIVRPASDVYSFGVVMLEALTGMPPVDVSWKDSDTLACSVHRTIKAHPGSWLRDVLDRRPAPEPTPGQLKALELVADTAQRCLWPKVNYRRPAMWDVVANLETALALLICSS